MNIIMKCPGCGKNILAKAGAGYTSEVITTDRKECPGCRKTVEIQIKIVATLVTPEGAKK